MEGIVRFEEMVYTGEDDIFDGTVSFVCVSLMVVYE